MTKPLTTFMATVNYDGWMTRRIGRYLVENCGKAPKGAKTGDKVKITHQVIGRGEK